MKKPTLLAILLLQACLISGAEEPERPELWFHVGEKLTYQIYWGVIPVGEAQVWNEWVNIEGKDMLSIKIRAESNRVLDQLYPVDYFMETVIEPETFLPVTFFWKATEGRRKRHEITTFDHEKGEAHRIDFHRDREQIIEIDPDTRDLLAFMYYIRTMKFEENQKYEKRVLADRKLYDLIINTRDRERIRLPGLNQRIYGIKCEPEAAFEGLFVRTGRLFVWVSDDERRVGLKVVARVPVANVHMLLKKVEGPGDDIYIRASNR